MGHHTYYSSILHVFAASASIDPRANGKISLVALIYIFITNVLMAAVGALLGVLVKPGKFGYYSL